MRTCVFFFTFFIIIITLEYKIPYKGIRIIKSAYSLFNDNLFIL